MRDTIRKRLRKDWWGFMVTPAQKEYRIDGRMWRLVYESEPAEEYFTTWTLEDYKCKRRGFVKVTP